MSVFIRSWSGLFQVLQNIQFKFSVLFLFCSRLSSHTGQRNTMALTPTVVMFGPLFRKVQVKQPRKENRTKASLNSFAKVAVSGRLLAWVYAVLVRHLSRAIASASRYTSIGVWTSSSLWVGALPCSFCNSSGLQTSSHACIYLSEISTLMLRISAQPMKKNHPAKWTNQRIIFPRADIQRN